MRRVLLSAACVLALVTSGAIPAHVEEPKPATGAWTRFASFDQDGDGTVEIASVEPVHTAGSGRRGVLVVIEPRLLDALPGAVDLRARVVRLADDLAHEGHRAEVISVALSPGTAHRDGRLVLALRGLLRAVHAARGLEAALLVGRFPDAMLVRTCNWRKRGTVVLHKGSDKEQKYEGTRWLRRIPELVAHRADIVLSDLDGRWEDVYVQARTRVPALQAIFADGIPKEGGAFADLETSSRTFEDFFHVDDGTARLEPARDGEPARLVLDDRAGGTEVSAGDAERSNVIARPEIHVSRIDARGVALRPKATVVGVDGTRLLDADGRPQAVRFASEKQVPDWRRIWEADPVLERRLLAEYLDRNHAYRTGKAEVAWRPSSLACGLGSGYGRMCRAAEDWEEAGEHADVHGKPNLARAVDWLAEPALLRTLRAHSDPWGSAFDKRGLEDLLAKIDGPAWSWTRRGDRLVPSLEACCRGGKLDWFLLRTLYESGAVAAAPSFYHHTGCEGISPPGARKRPYHHASYGQRQGAESLLFLANGLALVGRAKVFYDEPKGFAGRLAAGDAFGAAWAHYFDVESRALTWGKAGGDIGRKRAYFWSVLGDGTLRLTRP